MKLQNLKNNYPILLSYMEDKSYCKKYIKSIKQKINRILVDSKNHKWKTYDDIYQTYIEKCKNKNTLSDKRKILLIIKRFDLESKMPDGLKHYHKPVSYDLLCCEFKDFITQYRDIIKNKPNKSNYRKVECTACSFLLKIQESGVDSFALITEQKVLDTFCYNGTICRSSSFKNAIKLVFKTCAPFYSNNLCMQIISYLPDIKSINKNIQYLSKEEIRKIKFVLENESSISLQNKSIGLFALYTGLRSCDIAALTFDSIDWENDLIHIKQQKTGIPLTLPLRAVVGNAIFDYIKEERPKSLEKFIFLTVNAPYRRLHTSNLNAICVTIMNKAGIRKSPNDRRGFHLFRHHLATSLLENGVEHPVISAMLGHQSLKSISPYLSADFSHLKECALSIACFPIRKEVVKL